MNVLWKPQPQQVKFMERPEFEVLYGGAAGGGKSDALVVEALRQVHIPHYKGLILRKTYPQLSELIDKTRLLYPKAVPGARYNSTEHTWTFPSGAKIIFGSMQHKKDRINYQGKAYDFIGFDELTHFEYDEYTYLYSRCRPNGPGTRCYVRATTNPGGIGHNWVRDRFIDCAPPMTPVHEEVVVADPNGKQISIDRARVFVPATVFDNQELLKNDPGYIASLGMLPDAEKQALLYGDWNSFSGQVFREFKSDPAHFEDRRWTHVINPFEIPAHWTIYRSMDWGYSKPFSIHWYAVADRSERIYCIREFYGCTGEPNRGLQWTPAQVAEKVYEIEHDDPMLRGKEIFGIADPAIFASDDGVPIVDAFERYQLYFEKGDHQRIPGKMQIHHHLRFNSEGIPMLYFFKGCKHMIRTLPALVYDESNVEDINTSMEDHCYDELRYLCNSFKIDPTIPVEEESGEWTPPPADPLDLTKSTRIKSIYEY